LVLGTSDDGWLRMENSRRAGRRGGSPVGPGDLVSIDFDRLRVGVDQSE